MMMNRRVGILGNKHEDHEHDYKRPQSPAGGRHDFGMLNHWFRTSGSNPYLLKTLEDIRSLTSRRPVSTASISQDIIHTIPSG